MINNIEKINTDPIKIENSNTTEQNLNLISGRTDINIKNIEGDNIEELTMIEKILITPELNKNLSNYFKQNLKIV